MHTDNCPDIDTFSNLLLGKSVGQEREYLEQHLASCERCAETADTLTLHDDLTRLIADGHNDKQNAETSADSESVAICDLIARIKRAHQQLDTLRLLDTVEVPGRDQGIGRHEPPNTSSETSDNDFLAPPQNDDELGRLGEYRVLKVLGTGGMGVVFLAEDTRLKRRVALKTMKPTIASDSDSKSRFLREAQAIAALEHDHIVPIYGVGEDRGVPFIAMQYLKGETLAERLRKLTRLPQEVAIRLGKEIAMGLALAHANGLIHRDIKPENIWLEEKTDRAKILDFGLVSVQTMDDGLTQSGTVLGTPRYMAPEQAQSHPIDHRCDLFSLGSVLYHVLSGKPPFVANGFAATLFAVAHTDPVPLATVVPGTKPELAVLIANLLTKAPEQRTQTANEVVKQLDLIDQQMAREQQLAKTPHLFADTAIVHAPSIVVPPRRPPLNRVVVAAAGAFGLLAFLGILIITLRNRDGVETVLRVPEGTTIEPYLSEGTTVTIREETASPIPPARNISRIETYQWPADAPKPAIAPFDAEQASRHQQEWADYLGVPIEYTNSIGMRFRLIPPGQFVMGSSIEDIAEALSTITSAQWRRCIQSEAPSHVVTLTSPFYISIHEVTQHQFKTVTGFNPSQFPDAEVQNPPTPGSNVSALPVENVTWQSAVNFCNDLSSKEKLLSFNKDNSPSRLRGGSDYRLPTEAEWEYVCRAGTTTKFWCGNDDETLDSAAWLKPNSAGRTHPVGKLRPNAYGLFDTHGNVWEWVQDRWVPESYALQANGSATDPCNQLDTANGRVFRGSGWSGHPSHARSASRYAPEVMYANNHIGFRAVLAISVLEKKTPAR